jgi:uncharacterized protein YcfJ
MTGCYADGFTPRETGTVGGAALGAGGGALIGSTMGAPGTGALLGGLGGGLAGYLVGNEVQEHPYRYHHATDNGSPPERGPGSGTSVLARN